MKATSRLSGTILAAMFAALCGCFPTEPQWLPDSSGLIYPRRSETGTQLRHYDLKNDRTRDIADVGKSVTSPVGVSPGGDRYAVIRRKTEGGRKVGQVVVVETTGRIAHESRSFALDSESGNPEWDMVSWSPVGNQLLLWVSPARLYDIDTGKMEEIADCSPSAIFCVYRLSPFLPDGSGVILEMGDPEGEPNLVIRTGDGRLQPLKLTKAGERFKDSSTSQHPKGWPPPGVWRGNIARLAYIDGYVEIDVKKRTIDFDASESVERLWKAAEQEQWVGVASFHNPLCRVVSRRLPKDQGFFCVEYYSHPDAKPVVLVSRARSGYETHDLLPLYPSPNGLRMAIKYRHATTDGIRLMVVDAQGKIERDGEM